MERPDLEYALPKLRTLLVGKRIAGATLDNPIVARVMVEGTFVDLLVGDTVTAVERHGHFAQLELGKHVLAIVPMLAGRFWWGEPSAKHPRDTVFTLSFAEGTFCFRDDVQMSKIYLGRREQLDSIPQYTPIGVDVLSKTFTVDTLKKIAAKRREQVRVMLMNKALFDSFGNAYADETLWEAQLHPKTLVSKLGDDDYKRLHAAMVKVTTNAIKEIDKAQPPLDVKLRDFVKVRNKHGEPCPRCGGKIRRAGVHGHDTFFCPACQPETRKTSVVSWR